MTDWKRLATELAEAAVMGGVRLTTRTHMAIQAIEVALADEQLHDGVGSVADQESSGG